MIDASPGTNSTSVKGRSWWFSAVENTFSSTCSLPAKGFDETLKVILKAFDEQGPFDGILGFSQGAAAVAILCGLRNINEFSHHFDFVILAAGFLSRAEDHYHLFKCHFNIPSMHIIGVKDECITKDLSDKLAELFEKPHVVYHEGGHYFPVKGLAAIEYRPFLQQRLKYICKNSSNLFLQ